MMFLLSLSLHTRSESNRSSLSFSKLSLPHNHLESIDILLGSKFFLSPITSLQVAYFFLCRCKMIDNRPMFTYVFRSDRNELGSLNNDNFHLRFFSMPISYTLLVDRIKTNRKLFRYDCIKNFEQKELKIKKLK